MYIPYDISFPFNILLANPLPVKANEMITIESKMVDIKPKKLG
jgi:hypothetical protein